MDESIVAVRFTLVQETFYVLKLLWFVCMCKCMWVFVSRLLSQSTSCPLSYTTRRGWANTGKCLEKKKKKKNICCCNNLWYPPAVIHLSEKSSFLWQSWSSSPCLTLGPFLRTSCPNERHKNHNVINGTPPIIYHCLSHTESRGIAAYPITIWVKARCTPV